MEKEEIKKLQEEIEKDDKVKPKPAEKKLKVSESFDEVLKKMTKPKKS